MSWTAEITLKNNLTKEYTVNISKGQIFENKKIGTSKQNVAAKQDYRFTVPAKSSVVVEIEVLCINKELSPPAGLYNATNFKINQNFNNQDELWSIMDPNKK